MQTAVEDLVHLAKDGNREALEALIRQIQDRVYGLALRMLGTPADAEDATQEILIRIVTRLDSFRGESRFTTWTYRVAVNHLLTTRKRRAERNAMSFEEHVAWVEQQRAADPGDPLPDIEWGLVEREARLVCIQSLLLCLTRNERVAYVLSDVFDLTSREGAYVLDITPAAFRKRLSRARENLLSFLSQHCRHIDAKNQCDCERVAPLAVRAAAIDPDNLTFVRHPCHAREPALPGDYLEQLDFLQRMSALFKSHPDYAAPDSCVEPLRDLISEGRVVFLQ